MINISKQRFSLFKKGISELDWDCKFMRLRELGVKPLQCNQILDKHYFITKRTEADEEYFGV